MEQKWKKKKDDNIYRKYIRSIAVFYDLDKNKLLHIGHLHPEWLSKTKTIKTEIIK